MNNQCHWRGWIRFLKKDEEWLRNHVLELIDVHSTENESYLEADAVLTDEQLAFLNAFWGRLIWGLNRELEPTDEWLEDEDWFFWVTHPGCICTGFGHHNPLPLKCTGFGNPHQCGVSGIALQGVLRCQHCYPKLQKKEPT